VWFSDHDETTPPRPDGARDVTCTLISEANAARDAWHFWRLAKKLGAPSL
jgi:hypothetical protein